MDKESMSVLLKECFQRRANQGVYAVLSVNLRLLEGCFSKRTIWKRSVFFKAHHLEAMRVFQSVPMRWTRKACLYYSQRVFPKAGKSRRVSGQLTRHVHTNKRLLANLTAYNNTVESIGASTLPLPSSCWTSIREGDRSCARWPRALGSCSLIQSAVYTCRTAVEAVLSDVGGPAVRRLVFMRRRGGGGWGEND